ncbi:MAG: M28 family peptidase, partial [Hyphomicrobiales bacterium]|nr:M28 family peptidase [Hyphomicrobiales bacterium]
MAGRQSAIDGERMWGEFTRICDCGGRLLGTASELEARELLAQLGRDATGVACQPMPVPYDGWQAKHCDLTGPNGGQLMCHPLLRSPATGPGGLVAEVVDVGRGTPEEFAAHAAEIPGRIVMVRHELMFAAGTIHRSSKYLTACKAGAAGFLIAGPLPDSPVSGSSGLEDGMGVPALGISRDVADALAPTSQGRPAVRLVIEASEAPAEAPNLIFDMPGKTDEWVVLSAHIDGHDLAESAIDNASGLAVALAVAHALSGQVAT